MRYSIIYDKSCFKFEGDHVVTLDKRGRFLLPKIWAKHVGGLFVLGVDQECQRFIGTLENTYILAQSWLKDHESYRKSAEEVYGCVNYYTLGSSGRIFLSEYKDVFLSAAEPRSSQLLLQGHGTYFSGAQVGLGQSMDVADFDPFILMCEEALVFIDHSSGRVQNQTAPVFSGV